MVSETFYSDADGDGFGTPDLTAVDCTPPAGFVENSLDCDDLDARINPDATDYCDGLDNDCNAESVEVCPNLCAPQVDGETIYLFCAEGATNAAAAAICDQEGMHLARVDSAAEQTFLADGRVAAFGNRPKTWIGGSDAATENTWLWHDGVQFWEGRVNGSAVGGLFTFWRSDQPDNNNGNQDCILLRDSNSGRWQDSNCANSLRFICERDALQAP
jgi:hypothetical protein